MTLQSCMFGRRRTALCILRCIAPQVKSLRLTSGTVRIWKLVTPSCEELRCCGNLHYNYLHLCAACGAHRSFEDLNVYAPEQPLISYVLVWLLMSCRARDQHHDDFRVQASPGKVSVFVPWATVESPRAMRGVCTFPCKLFGATWGNDVVLSTSTQYAHVDRYDPIWKGRTLPLHWNAIESQLVHNLATEEVPVLWNATCRVLRQGDFDGLQRPCLEGVSGRLTSSS